MQQLEKLTQNLGMIFLHLKTEVWEVVEVVGIWKGF